ncbi:Cytochrome b5 heme-binding domain-containing protein [Pseudozyma hubeiensis]|nr:Cytochrome b5 heme-binding domain-containing protein [Pseudozyma hubeiensis]
MVLGLGKKKSKVLKASSSAAAGPSAPVSNPPPERGSSRPVNGGAQEPEEDAPLPPTRFKYGAAISKAVVDVAGLPVNVFGLDELTPAPARASAPPPPPVCVVIHMHGRGGSADNEEKIARQLYDRISRDKAAYRSQENAGLVATSSIQRDHLLVTFDARNHGQRVTNPQGQKAWKQGNTRHAMDLYGMIVGGARDASFIVDLLSSYIFPQDDRTVVEWVITGKSLGGHATWHVLAEDARIKIGVPFIGMPDFSRLLASRTRTSFVTNGPPYVPASLKALVEKIDPARTAYDSFDPRRNPFWGKKICVLSGANDKLVHWDWNEDFLKALVVGEPTGSRGEMPGLKIHRRPGVGHEVTEEMVEEAGEWIWRWGIVAPQ